MLLKVDGQDEKTIALQSEAQSRTTLLRKSIIIMWSACFYVIFAGIKSCTFCVDDLYEQIRTNQIQPKNIVILFL